MADVQDMEHDALCIMDSTWRCVVHVKRMVHDALRMDDDARFIVLDVPLREHEPCNMEASRRTGVIAISVPRPRRLCFKKIPAGFGFNLERN